jgi:apolipoprotein N-acyltransferase
LRRAAVSAVALSALLTAGIFAYGKARLARLPETPVLKILAVQGNIPPRLKEITGLSEADQMKNVWHILQTYQRLTVEGLAAPGAADARLVVWPETMVTYPVSIGREIRLFLQRDVAQRARRPFLFGCLHAWVDAANRTKICNSACLMSPSGEILARYDKIHLVLFSEYLPLKNTMKFLAALVPENFGSLTPGARNVLFEVAGLRFGVAVCYEDTMAGRIRSIRAAGADFALNVTNDAWFRQSEELEQHLAISVFRAVESRMGIVRDGNTGLTASIAPTGRIMQTAPRDTPCATILQAYGPAPLSFHVRYGDLFAWACLIFASASLLATYVRARRMP